MVSLRSQTDGISRGFNIQDFRSFRDQQGILRNHDYHIEIPWPEGLIRDPGRLGTWRNLELVCESVVVPPTILATYRVHRYSYGPMETKPTYPMFPDLGCTFLTDQYSNVWKFLYDWQRLAVNFDFNPNPTATTPMEIYEISYTHEYCVDIYLYIYSPFGQLVRKVAFRQAYPTVVADVPLAWAAGNQMVKISVQFAFFDWSEEIVPGQAGASQVPQGFGPTPIK